MSDRPWKQAERYAAGLLAQIAAEFGVAAGTGRRYWANSGEDVDVENDGVLAQVKNVKRLSLADLEKLAVEAERQGNQRLKTGIVLVKRRAGHGVETPWLVVMTAPTYRDQSGPLPGEPRA